MADTPARHWPAIELRPGAGPPNVQPDTSVDDRLSLAIDDLPATAVDHPAAGISRVFFSDAASRDAGLAALERALGDTCEVRPVDVPDEGWLQKVQSSLGAVRVGRFDVAPPWDLPAPRAQEPARLLIVIEPSMGFGTGHHESTRLCLLALEALGVERRRVLDVGTGSGVLAIAAALLGAARVVAIDVDPDAVAAARDNVNRNGLEAVVEVRETDVAATEAAPVDVVLANLTGATLAREAPTLAGLVAPAGALVTSGFTGDQAPMVIAAFEAFEATARLSEAGWECIVFRRP